MSNKIFILALLLASSSATVYLLNSKDTSSESNKAEEEVEVQKRYVYELKDKCRKGKPTDNICTVLKKQLSM